MEHLDNFTPQTTLTARIVLFVVSIGLVLALVFALFFYQPGSSEVPSWIPKTAPPKPLVVLAVESMPRGAKVYMDDGSISLGKTPGQVSLLPGKHSLRFELAGFPIKTVVVDTATDKQASVSWDGVVIEIETDPSDLGIMLDGNDLGRSPYTLALPKSDKPRELKVLYGTESRMRMLTPDKNQQHFFDFRK